MHAISGESKSHKLQRSPYTSAHHREDSEPTFERNHPQLPATQRRQGEPISQCICDDPKQNYTTRIEKRVLT